MPKIPLRKAVILYDTHSRDVIAVELGSREVDSYHLMASFGADYCWWKDLPEPQLWAEIYGFVDRLVGYGINRKIIESQLIKIDGYIDSLHPFYKEAPELTTPMDDAFFSAVEESGVAPDGDARIMFFAGVSWAIQNSHPKNETAMKLALLQFSQAATADIEP